MCIRDRISSVPYTYQDMEATLVFIRDVTERNRAEILLQQSESRYRELYEKSPLGYQSLDADGCFLEVNDSWLNVMGYKREEVIGKWFGDFVAPYMVEAFRERFPKFKEAGEVHNEFELKHRNGHLVTVAFDGKIGYDEKGKFKQTHCIPVSYTHLDVYKRQVLRWTESKHTIS